MSILNHIINIIIEKTVIGINELPMKRGKIIKGINVTLVSKIHKKLFYIK